MSSVQEFENTPVTANKLEPARHFAASYAGEHVAGTEFVIGALFVTLGVSTYDVILGLALGNLLAVLMWGLVCAPIAVRTRLTLYAYLEKVAGPGIVKIYSVVNGVLFCIIAGAMITVSASAIRIPFGIPPQVTWYPSSFSFVLVAVVCGIVISYVAVAGFKKVAQFAEICAPWMILMFLLGAIAVMPMLIGATDGVNAINSFADFAKIGDMHIWVEQDNGIGFWHVAAFAWICNLPMHGAMSDMTILRYAKKSSYGYFSALGMFLGHYMAWICAGVMGAAAALMLNSSITQLDAGEVAYQALGWAGILAVVIAGWTTSNPTIYRAGLAFQSLNPKWNRVKVTAIVGVFTTIIACFPFAFSQMLDLLGIMGLAIAPVGAIIFTEHWLMERCGLTQYWSHFSGNNINKPALFAWFGSLFIAAALNIFADIHIFFLLIPTWVAATVLYLTLARVMGGRKAFPEQTAQERQLFAARQAQELNFLRHDEEITTAVDKTLSKNSRTTVAKYIALSSLVCCFVMTIWVFTAGTAGLETYKEWLIYPSIVYFIFGTIWLTKKEEVETEEVGNLSESGA
ncbi:MAG: nucleoside transporter [Colwellia sp.]|nr:nucleoside transporter [Colwellia sp.]